MKTKLSDRIRPNSEAAPWVIDEIKKLEQQIAAYDAVEDVCEQRVNDMRLALMQMINKSDALLQQIAAMQPVVDAAIKWWLAQEHSDTEYHTAEHELSATVGKYYVRNKL